ncbi:hypothetical protein SCAR479_05378 [Seiridium cardinale]|uniref:Alcohol dehydrogenase-like C-terminal domain-containing protein n=1 Tax=Seiridium cardinale TaxID=138064 RepID=A0ABR2XWB5_9PEZI
MTNLSGSIDCLFRQYAVFDESNMVRQPQNSSLEEASTLTCAATTSWNAPYGLKPGKSWRRSSRARQWWLKHFCVTAVGAMVVATTSSTAKASRLKELGADHVIHYREDANWGQIAKSLTTHGEGFGRTIEVDGAATMKQSFAAVKVEGVISIIGLFRRCNSTWLRGIVVSSKEMMQDTVDAIEDYNVHPVLERPLFPEAYKHLRVGSHFGKVVIQIA